MREALQLGHNYMGTEHILLGLIREGEGVAAQVLQKLGADLNRVRQTVIQLLSGYTGGKGEQVAAGGGPADPRCPAAGVDVAVVVGAATSSRPVGQPRGHGPGHRRLRGDAVHRAERPGHPGRPGEARRLHPHAVGPDHRGGGRAVYPTAGHPPPGEGPRGHLRRGTGNPYFTTDTAGALRACEIGARRCSWASTGWTASTTTTPTPIPTPSSCPTSRTVRPSSAGST